jgi:hypothetical protein
MSLDLFGLPLPEPKPGRPTQPYRIRQAERLRLGRHPLNALPLAEDLAARCGNCANLRKHQLGKTYWKCALGPFTHGPATDLKLRWPGCSQWQPRAG